MKTYTMIFAGMLTLASCSSRSQQAESVEASQCDVATETAELSEIDDELVLNGNVACERSAVDSSWQ